MNINKKINKINKLIINNKELLNIKYKERNDLLENISKNKNMEYDDLDKLDKCIEDIESENKDLEKDLKEINKTDLNINIKKDKTRLCKYFKSSKGCDKGNNCSFAHDEIELKKITNTCFSGSKCYKKYCEYSHPKNWSYKDNIIICEFFKNGYCIHENNCKFKHIKETNDEIVNNNIEMNENKEYQDDLKLNKYNYIKEIVNNYLHEDIIYKIIEDKKKNSNYNIDNEILSENLKIIVDGKEYKNLETIFNNNDEINKIDFSNINSGIQEKTDIFNITDDITELINIFQNNLYKYIKDLKNVINNKNIKKKDRIYLIFSLNKIISEIDLFKNNFEDIKKIKILE